MFKLAVMIQISRKSISLLLVFLFASLGLTKAQIKELGRIDYFSNNYVPSETVGNKLLFYNRKYEKLWETDGTSLGTKRVNIHPEKKIFLESISEDSLLIMHSVNVTGFKIYLYTATMTSPKEIATIPDFYGNMYYEKYGDLVVISNGNELVFLKYAEASYVKKKYDLIGDISPFWTIAKNKLYFRRGFPTQIYSIDLNDYSLQLFMGFDYYMTTVQATPDESHLLIFETKRLWISDGTIANTVSYKDLPVSIRKTFDVQLETKAFFTLEYAASGNGKVDSTVLYVTDGTTDGTFPIKTFEERWPNYAPTKVLKKLGDKIYFIEAGHLYQSDGTVAGTYPIADSLGIEFRNFYLQNSEKILMLVGIENEIPASYYLNQLGEIIPLENENVNKNRLFKTTEYYTKFGDSVVMCSLLDLDYGLELHRLDLRTNKTERMTDAIEGNNWGSFVHLGFIKNEFFFAQNKNDGEYYLMKINTDAPAPVDEPIKKNYDWAELIPQSRNDTKFISGIDVAPDGSCQVAFQIKSRINEGIESRYNPVLQHQRVKIQDTTYLSHLVRLSQDGRFEWAKTLPKFPNQFKLASSMDLEGNAIVVLTLAKSVSKIGAQEYFLSDGALLLLKYSPEGQLIWSKQVDIGVNGRVSNVIIDSKNNINVSGIFSSTSLDFDGIHLRSSRNPTVFIAQYSPNGSIHWVNSFALLFTWPQYNSPVGMAIGKNDMVYFYQRMKKNIQKIECQNTKHRIRVTAVHGETGKEMWHKEFVGEDFCFVADIDASPFGNIFVLGGYNATIDFDQFKLTSDSCNQNNRFLLELDYRDGHVVQVHKIAHSNEFCTELKFDKNGNYYLLGSKDVNQYFGINDGLILPNIQEADWIHSVLFIEKYDALGQLINKKLLRQNSTYFQVTNRWSQDFNPKIALGADGDIYLACQILDNLDTINITYPVYKSSIFMMKFNMGLDALAESDGLLEQSDVLMSPNPVDDVLYIRSADIDFTQAKVIIYSMDGKQWKLPIDKNHGQVTVNMTLLPQGVYAVAVYLGERVLAQKIVKDF